jgi:hypothetical protein
VTAAGLIVAGVHLERMRAADLAVADAWDALSDYTGLTGDALIRLVMDDDAEVSA